MYLKLREWSTFIGTIIATYHVFSFCHSPNGWIDNELALAWFRNDLLPRIRTTAGNEPCVIFVDSQVTHLTLELLELAAENGIEFLAYPTRTTHALQGLDVVCFAWMKDIYQEEVIKFTELHGRKVGKGDFAEVFGKAYLRAFTEENILAAFRATGIHPFNPSVISDSQMKPSEPTAVRGSFPMVQPSPVKAVMKAFREVPPTNFDLMADTDLAIDEPEGGVRANNRGAVADIAPETPRSPRVQTINIVPQRRVRGGTEAVERLRILTTSLAKTKTGAYLVSKGTLAPDHPVPSIILPSMLDLPTPDWSILRDRLPPHATCTELAERVAGLEAALGLSKVGIQEQNKVIELDRTQLIIQDMHLRKQQIALRARSGKKKSKTKKMKKSDGRGRHLTDAAFIKERRALENDRKKEEKAKEKRQRDRDMKKVAKELAETKWKAYCDECKQADAARDP